MDFCIQYVRWDFAGLALSVFATQIHLSQRERQCISRVQYMLTESHKGLSLWESWQSHRL